MRARGKVDGRGQICSRRIPVIATTGSESFQGQFDPGSMVARGSGREVQVLLLFGGPLV